MYPLGVFVKDRRLSRVSSLSSTRRLSAATRFFSTGPDPPRETCGLGNQRTAPRLAIAVPGRPFSSLSGRYRRRGRNFVTAWCDLAHLFKHSGEMKWLTLEAPSTPGTRGRRPAGVGTRSSKGRPLFGFDVGGPGALFHGRRPSRPRPLLPHPLPDTAPRRSVGRTAS